MQFCIAGLNLEDSLLVSMIDSSSNPGGFR